MSDYKLKYTLLFFAFYFLHFAFCISANAQPVYPQNYFRSPLDIRLKLAGNFGEIRANHFHPGLDIKTDSVEGKNVYAAADGYVSRMKVSPFGYGNALYITHPNGYVTVYGHLQRYCDAIANYVRQKQYEKQSFEIELFPDSNLFRVRKGDVIALSGNSGGSSGPHLHFEIRDAVTEKIINPLLFGFAINDTLPPLLKSLCVYENKNLIETDTNFISTDIKPVLTPLSKTKNLYYYIFDTLHLTMDAQFGFEADDLCDDGLNPLGIYKTSLMVDDSDIWHYSFDTFAFDETRYVNAHIDYAEKILSKKIYERCYRLPGDSFSVYLPQSLFENGIYSPKKIHHAKLVLSDYFNNETILNFYFKADKKNSPEKKNKKTIHLRFNKPINFKTNNFSLQVPSKALYDDIDFEYSFSKKINGFYSDLHKVNDNTIPLHTAATISIKPDIRTTYEPDKALIVMVDSNGGFNSMGGSYKNGFVTASIRTFGSFAVAIDTVSPNITWRNESDSISHKDTLIFLIEDKLSGISTYKVTVNGEIIIPVYDAKNDLLKVECARFPQGAQLLKITVSDSKANVSEFSKLVFVRRD